MTISPHLLFAFSSQSSLAVETVSSRGWECSTLTLKWLSLLCSSSVSILSARCAEDAMVGILNHHHHHVDLNIVMRPDICRIEYFPV
jgi:hypothetical protein